MKLPPGVDSSSFHDAVLGQEVDVKIVEKSGCNSYEVELIGADGSPMFQTSDANQKGENLTQKVVM